jgi:hypothetical protein
MQVPESICDLVLPQQLPSGIAGGSGVFPLTCFAAHLFISLAQKIICAGQNAD